jgi:hypothetical protein
LSAGFVKIVGVASYSTRTPLRLPSSICTLKNAVMSAIRAACCMLCVTITIVYSRFSSCMRSSIRVVEIGIEGGGRLVHEEDVRLDSETARDAEPLLLSAREAERALVEPVLDLVPERGLLKARSTRPSRSSVIPSTRGPKATLAWIVFGKGFGFWKTIPIRFRTSTASTLRP